ncbi:SRPBCC domain-containing protein [Cryobacterium sp. TMS1-20-1]|uniref:SRPBCC domain-containing protein n=1 Tax=Cryobacterium sp. TMS1-20-1 TaxID=1259223 RepID=UPI00141BED55|nr:SRPBCC domain-containing protein [Cryobacterium sp. TMS1-20-1]
MQPVDHTLIRQPAHQDVDVDVDVDVALLARGDLVYVDSHAPVSRRKSWGEPHGDPDDTPTVTITIEPVVNGTSMTFDLHGVDGSRGDGFFYDGWQDVLDSLGRYLS